MKINQKINQGARYLGSGKVPHIQVAHASVTIQNRYIRVVLLLLGKHLNSLGV